MQQWAGYLFIFILIITGGYFLYNNVFSAATIISLNTDDGLVGYWSFEEGQGTIAGDMSGNGNHGTLTNMPGTEVVHRIRQDCSGYNDCYESLSAWEAAQNRDLVAAGEIAVARIEGTWTAADTSIININGWTTDENHYIHIYTTEEARHDGVWDTNKYRVTYTLANNDPAFQINEDNVIVDGLQIEQAHTTPNDRSGVYVNGDNISVANNIIRLTSDNAQTSERGIEIEYDAALVSIWNNIVYNWNQGIRNNDMAAGNVHNVVNNTVYNSKDVGISLNGYPGSAATVRVYNNIVQSASSTCFGFDFDGNVQFVASNNIADDGTAPGPNSATSTLTFVSTSTGNFHLAAGDTDAIDAGLDLSSTSTLSFTTDIDSGTRDGAWDIGADEYGADGYFEFVSGGSWIDGARGGGVQMFGKDGQSIRVSPSSSIDGHTSFTICMWVKPYSFTNEDNDSPVWLAQKGWALRLTDTGQAYFRQKTSSSYSNVTTSESLELNEWHHVCGVTGTIGVDGPWLYVNGSSTEGWPGTGTADDDSGADLEISCQEGHCGFGNYHGAMDEVRYYSRQLSHEEVRSLYKQSAQKFQASQADKLTDGLVGYWSFDGPDMDWASTTAEVKDVSGIGNHGNMTDWDGTAQTPTQGVLGQALELRGPGWPKVRLNSHKSLEMGTGDMAISTWLNVDDMGSDELWLFHKNMHTADCFFEILV
jgi:hypothetical protein